MLLIKHNECTVVEHSRADSWNKKKAYQEMRSGQSNEMNEQKSKLFRVLRSHGNDKNTFLY